MVDGLMTVVRSGMMVVGEKGADVFEEQLQQARKKAECLIGTRDRSEAELRERLRRAGFQDSIVEQVMDEVLAVGLVDDCRFVQVYVASKRHSGWGRIRIEQELRRYGIELRQCEGYPEEFFPEGDELERACACLESFCSRAKDQNAARYRHLMAKGFSPEIAWKASFASLARTGGQGDGASVPLSH
jgi:regulatory protein